MTERGRRRGTAGGRVRLLVLTALVGAAALVASACIPPPAATESGFQLRNAFSGLNLPTSVRFADDGRAFVAERAGRIWVYEELNGSRRELTNLSSRVTTMYDRGLMGIELDPDFTTGRPYLYALYSYDAPPGGTHPTWTDGCIFEGFGNNGVCGITTGQLMKIEVGPDNTAVSETVLLTDWCQQFGGHSVNDLKFGPEGALYASAGEGANFYSPDWGQFNGDPCGSAPFEGGMFRAQSARSETGPVQLGGSVIRIDPDTGDAWPTNPWAGDVDENRARIIAYGFRNPFRLDIDHQGLVTVADVGWGLWEELNTFDPDSGEVPNFGWPCYEGPERQPEVDAAEVPMCETLADTDVTPPSVAYRHNDPLGQGCSSGGTSITGAASVRNGAYPAPFNNGMFIGDYSRQCIFFLPRAGDGEYRFDTRRSIVQNVGAVDMQIGPDGDLFIVDILNGTVRQLVATGQNAAPEAAVSATPDSGALPLTVDLSAEGSVDGDGDDLTYEWDLTGNDVFDDATGPTTQVVFDEPGTYTVSVRVSDPRGGFDIASTTVVAGNTRPEVEITEPDEGVYSPGTMVPFAGTATDVEDGTLPADAFSWTFTILHCDEPDSCHTHDVGALDGAASGEIEMPLHERPSWLEIELTVTDSGGLSNSVVRSIEIGDP